MFSSSVTQEVIDGVIEAQDPDYKEKKIDMIQS